MHRCEFCHACYHARPQVKHPRACQNCQEKRQRENEKAWHFKYKSRFDREYHEIQRGVRRKRFLEMASSLCKWIRTGALMCGTSFSFHGWEAILAKFLQELGIRNANKLWPA
jgi:hypothetical protein